MSDTEIYIVTGPTNYSLHSGSLSRLNNFFSADQLSRAVWVYGECAVDVTRPYLPEALHLAKAKCLLFTGHYSETDVTQLAEESEEDCGVVIGMGGGALLDTAKALVHRLDLPFVSIPTIAATCTTWTLLSVWYNDAGRTLRFETFADTNFLVLVESEVILDMPGEYLLAGVGDTLAKWCKAVVPTPQPETLPLTVCLGVQAVQTIHDVLLGSSEQALADRQQGAPSRTFRNVVGAIIAGGGMVGGLGERYARAAAARSAHSDLTVLPQTEKFLHGTKVVYGILVQNALLGQDVMLAQLITAYQRLNLPTRLAQLEVDINNRAEIDKVIAHTLHPMESIHALPVTLTPETLRTAFEKVESFMVWLWCGLPDDSLTSSGL